METDKWAHLTAVTNTLTNTKYRWMKNYSWFPVKQRELYAEMDRIYEEARLQLGNEYFTTYAKERRLNERLYEDVQAKGDSFANCAKLKEHVNEKGELPLLYYYENCGQHKTCVNN